MIEVQVSTPQTIEVAVGGKIDITALPAEIVAYARQLVAQAREASDTAQEASRAAQDAQTAAEDAKATAEQALEGKLVHERLTGREAGGQHPVEAIEGLSNELNRIPAPTEALTNFELEELLK